jgi:hypothetical protein
VQVEHNTPTVAPPTATFAIATPSASVTAPVASAANGKLVTVIVRQPDVKVVMRGVAVEGPPYVIEVPKGKRVALEISKPGYATRKLVLDGKQSVEVLGLVAKKE